MHVSSNLLIQEMGTKSTPRARRGACLHLPIETSKLMGLSPIFRSIMVASKNAPKSKNSSYFSGTIYRKKKENIRILDRPGFLGVGVGDHQEAGVNQVQVNL